jgi:hypothetical protein
MNWRGKSLLGLCCLLLVTVVDAAPRGKQKKKPRPPKPPIGEQVANTDTFDVKVNVGKKSLTVYCFKEDPGYLKANPDGSFLFFSYKDQINYLKKRQKNRRLSIKARRKLKKKQKNYLAISKATGKNCVKPPFLELDPYTGSFGKAEARLLFERFAFGASEQQVNEAVAAGLDATIAKLTTFASEGNLDIVESDIRCDTYIAGHPVDNPAECTPGDSNDFVRSGLRFGIYLKFALSPNAFFHKLFMFLHDERMAASHLAAGSYEKYAIVRHLDMLRRAAFSGDYRQFMRDWNEDLLGHLKWLDGASNKGTSPNENYAREFWELGTVGPTDLYGRAVYTDMDVAQSALAFSGWVVQRDEAINGLGQEYPVDVKAYAPDRHAPGTFTIFAGTPWQASVVNSEDVLRATFAHPRTAEHLAEDIWHEFINPWPTPTVIESLAKIIRDNDYNLIPVFRTVMKSRAIFNARSRKSLLKHPVELLFGFLRTFPGYPVSRWENSSEWHQYDDYLETMGQRPMAPSTVFGWNERKLASEAYVLGWREVVTRILGQTKEDYDLLNYNFYNSIVGNVASSNEMLLKLSEILNVPLTLGQAAALDEFMNYNRRTCSSWHTNDVCKAGGTHFLERELFDPSSANTDWESGLYKVQGVMAIMMMLPDYRMK